MCRTDGVVNAVVMRSSCKFVVVYTVNNLPHYQQDMFLGDSWDL